MTYFSFVFTLKLPTLCLPPQMVLPTTFMERGLLHLSHHILFPFRLMARQSLFFLWSKQAFPDSPRQQIAFQVLAAKFVLHYLPTDVVINNDVNSSRDTHTEMLRCKHLVISMVGSHSSSNNLVMLLAGSSGSGKTAVVSEFHQYALQYCSYINEPFFSNVVLLTAYPGGTSLSNGCKPSDNRRYPLCSTLCLHGSLSSVQHENNDHFLSQVKMIIVDELSIYSSSDMKAMENRLKRLTTKKSSPYGGVDIVFVADLKQLAPVRSYSFYNHFLPSINCYMSLEPLSYLRPSSLSLTTLSEYVPPLKKRRIDDAHDPIPDTAYLVAVTPVRGRPHFHYLVCILFFLYLFFYSISCMCFSTTSSQATLFLYFFFDLCFVYFCCFCLCAASSDIGSSNYCFANRTSSAYRCLSFSKQGTLCL